MIKLIDIYFSFYIYNFFVLIFQLFIIIHSLNICRKTAAETRELCQKIKTVFMNSLNQVSSDFDRTVLTVINSLWYIDLDLNKDYMLTLTYQVHGTECKYSMFILIKYIISLKSFLRIIIEDNSPFLLFKYLYFLKINILYT